MIVRVAGARLKARPLGFGGRGWVTREKQGEIRTNLDGPLLAQYCTDSTITATNRTTVKSTMPSVRFLLGVRQCTRAKGPSQAVTFEEKQGRRC